MTPPDPRERVPFKEFLDARAVARLARIVQAAHPPFPSDAFMAGATTGLSALALSARVAHVGDALVRHLPAPFEATARVLEAVAERWPRVEPGETPADFAAWPLFHVVPAAGLDDFERGFELLRRLTPLFSAEMAIRPFLDRYGDRAFERLHQWVDDPDEHVRRLVSEGTRPRLPWATRVPRLSADPGPGLALLDRLVDDPSLYVRRSVANHLNDVSRDHPALAVAAATRWLERPSAARRWVVRHGLRTLIKGGHPAAFALLGHSDAPTVAHAGLTLGPDPVPFGGRAAVTASLTAASEGPPGAWVVDFAVSYMGARGPGRRKVFKGSTVHVEPGATCVVRFALDFRPITTRRYYPGPHEVAVQVNGTVLARVAFELAGPA
jgi:3-methyladenine DNA glycosylase AlkC